MLTIEFIVEHILGTAMIAYGLGVWIAVITNFVI